MASQIPSAADFRARLQLLTWAEVQSLCDRHGAAFTTVWKVRQGQTENPGIETVRRLWPDLPKPSKTSA